MKYIAPWLFTTYKCNLDCHYCYVKQKDILMSKSTLSTILNRFSYLLNNNYIEHVVLRIAGGEPLLAFDNWSTLVSDFLIKYPNNSSAGIISNFTTLIDEHISYFKRFNFGFGLSLDGWNFSKPYKNGVSSAHVVRRNIDRLNMHNMVDISTVITSKSIESIEELAEWIAKRNINWGIYLDHYYDGDFDITYLAHQIFKAIDVLFANNYDVINKLKFNNIKLINNYDGCTAGQNLIAIDTEGYVHDCQTSIYKRPKCHISHLIPQNKAKYNIPDICTDCPIVNYCKGGCKLHNNFGDTCKLMLLVMNYILNFK